ncbi:hypothetical protein TNCV_2940691 [Trichonephila clavipes]|nr:hypothetical protein TNCV_2940691 [Trichonephila clavipes]
MHVKSVEAHILQVGMLWKESISCQVDSHGTRAVKVMDSRPAYLEFESSITEHLPCMGVMHIRSVGSSKSSRWCGCKEKRVSAQVSSSLFGRGSKLRDPSRKPSSC